MNFNIQCKLEANFVSIFGSWWEEKIRDTVKLAQALKSFNARAQMNIDYISRIII